MATDEIIGRASWLVYEDNPEKEQLNGIFCKTEDQMIYAIQLIAAYLVPSRSIIQSAEIPVIYTLV